MIELSEHVLEFLQAKVNDATFNIAPSLEEFLKNSSYEISPGKILIKANREWFEDLKTNKRSRIKKNIVIANL